MHSLTMNWSARGTTVFTPANVSHTHGTDPTFTPEKLIGGGNSTVFVDQSQNLGPGPVGNYTWASVDNPNLGVSCHYDHPSGTGQTSVTATPNGFLVSFDGTHWSSTPITANPKGSNITMTIYVSDTSSV
ncbi:MAG: hypothetical protein ACK4RV_00805 [Caulobacter sp.]